MVGLEVVAAGPAEKGPAQCPQEAEVRMSSTLRSRRGEVSMGQRG